MLQKWCNNTYLITVIFHFLHIDEFKNFVSDSIWLNWTYYFRKELLSLSYILLCLPHLKTILATKKGTRDQWALQHGAKVGFIGKKINHSSKNLLILLIFYIIIYFESTRIILGPLVFMAQLRLCYRNRSR